MDRSAPFSLARERPKAWTLKRMAFHLGSPLVLQEFPELGKTMDLVIHGNTRNRRFLPGVNQQAAMPAPLAPRISADSYKHLTLPTKRRVANPDGPVT